jgi:peptide-methionine (R)-S-oxide reductase
MSETGNSPKIQKSDSEWRDELSPEQYRILRQAGTERAFTGPFWNSKEKGLYRCAGCGEELFVSDTKFDSGCGWPSYFEPVNPGVIDEFRDVSHGMVRTEVRCANCGGHLGHVFPDGPPPTGLRYCINGHAMTFEPLR